MYEFFGRGVRGQCIYNTPSANPAPMTPWAQATYDAAKPGYGPKASVDTTDPISRCNPSGIPPPPYSPQPLEIAQPPARACMLFAHARGWPHNPTDRGRPPQHEAPAGTAM